IRHRAGRERWMVERLGASLDRGIARLRRPAERKLGRRPAGWGPLRDFAALGGGRGRPPTPRQPGVPPGSPRPRAREIPAPRRPPPPQRFDLHRCGEAYRLLVAALVPPEVADRPLDVDAVVEGDELLRDAPFVGVLDQRRAPLPLFDLPAAREQRLEVAVLAD